MSVRSGFVFLLLVALGVHAEEAPSADPSADPAETIPVPFLRAEVEALPATDETRQEKRLDPVTVTATRTERRIFEVPASVSIVDAAQIEERGAGTLGAAVQFLPGVAIEGGPRPDAEFINVRGLSGPRVLLVVDGARQDFYGGHRSNLLLDPELIRSIEVLRGPASALWGSDAVGGVLAATTRDAGDFLEDGERLAVRLCTGHESAAGERLGSALTATRLGDFEALADISWRESGDFRIGGGSTEPNSAYRTLGTLARLAWKPEGAHGLGLDWQGFQEHGLSPSNPAMEVDDENPLLDRENDQRYLIARYRYAPAGGWLQDADINVYRDDLDIRENRVDEPRRDHSVFHTIGLSAKTSLPLWGESLVTLGVDGYRDSAKATRDDQPRPQFPDSRRTTQGGFVQAELPAGAVSLVPAVRYDRYRAQSNTGAAAPLDASAVSPKIGAVWSATDALRLRASWSRGFRAPSLIELYSSGQHFLGNNFIPNPDLRPEQARSTEAGFSWNREGFEIGGSLYRNRIRDFIELMVVANVEMVAPQCLPPSPETGCINRNDDGSASAAPPFFVGGSTTSHNLTRATLQGGELQASYSLGALKLSTDFSRVRGRNDDSGEPLASIPADTLHAALDWQLPLGLKPRLGYTHVAAQNLVPTQTPDQVTISPSTPLDDMLLSRFSSSGTTPPPPTSGYALWDASLSWAPPVRLSWLRDPKLVLGVDNLSDVNYREHLNSIPSPGRNLRVSLSSTF